MDFLGQAKTLAEEILRDASALKLTGQPDLNEQEIDAYVNLVNKREPMVAKLVQLIKQDTSADEDGKRAVDTIIAGILSIDKEHRRIMEHINKTVLTSLKETRSGKKLNQAYSHPYRELSSGLLDAKQ